MNSRQRFFLSHNFERLTETKLKRYCMQLHLTYCFPFEHVLISYTVPYQLSPFYKMNKICKFNWICMGASRRGKKFFFHLEGERKIETCMSGRLKSSSHYQHTGT